VTGRIAMIAAMCASTNQDLLLALPVEVRRQIFSYLDLQDVVHVSKLSKAHRADLKELGAQPPPQPTQRDPRSADGWQLYHDALAGLFWLDASLAKTKPDPVCVAVSVLAAERSKPELVITSNTGWLPDVRTQVTWLDQEFNGTWKVVKYDQSLKGYVEPWIVATTDTAITNLKLQRPVAGALRSSSSVLPDRDFTRAAQKGKRQRAPALYMHAEMKILDLLWSGALRPVTDDNVVYIGLSLLCCRHCMRAITAFNAIAPGGITVAVAGTHDIPYEPRAWLIPRFLQDKDHTEASDAFFAQYTEGKIGFVVSFDPNIPVDDVRPSVLRLTKK
jgi:hypothetical protein